MKINLIVANGGPRINVFRKYKMLSKAELDFGGYYYNFHLFYLIKYKKLI